MYILAEAAQGYEGSLDKALLLTKAAHVAGADGIKFQIIYADELCVQAYEYYDLFKSLEMPESSWQKVVEFASECGLEVFFDVFGYQSINLAKELNVKKVKIHSTSYFDDELFEEVQGFAETILVSIGGIRPEELYSVLKQRTQQAKDKMILMYGFQSEPTPLNRNNLARIDPLREAYGLPVGFMDHSDGVGLQAYTLSSLALGLGVTFFEKHISLDRSLELEDYVSALAPREFADYSENLRELNEAIGSSSLDLTDEEEGYRVKALKVLVATKDIRKGDLLDDSMIALKRPDGEQSGTILRKSDAVGKKAVEEILEGQNILSQLVG